MKKFALLACVCVLAVAAPQALARTTSHNTRGPVSGLDKVYLKMSMQTDLAEIAGGKLAQSRSHNSAVLSLSAGMITDHTKAYSNAAALARKLRVSVPKSPSPAQTWDALAVAQFPGTRFDHWFSSLQVYDHLQAIDLTRDEINGGSNRLVRKDARTNLPVLRMHLQMAQAALNASP